ncbi:hypothetical protein BKA93DRAFT_730891 [Sparassis latifolia]
MHLAALNLPELIIPLLRGTFECDKLDDKATWDWVVLIEETWSIHGETVANSRPYLPGCFDRPPRNPAEKISSGYKAKEYLTYVYGLLPALLRTILPEKYWRHFCKLVFAIRLLHKRSITATEVALVHKMLVEYENEFEELYYQRLPSRLHFCRPCVHTLGHLASEVSRLGPLIYYTQWTMERTIGNLGEEIKQPSRPYANLSQRGLRRSQVNALKVMVPLLAEEESRSNISNLTCNLGDGYHLLHAREKEARRVDSTVEADAIRCYMSEAGLLLQDRSAAWHPVIARWARLRLPNAQIVRSAWKEIAVMDIENTRMSRNIKAHTGNNHGSALAMVSLYSEPDAAILQSSYNTVWMCKYHRDNALKVVDVKNIAAVVAMVPEPGPDGRMPEGAGRLTVGHQYFVVEKTGLDVSYLGGVEDPIDDE